MSKIFLFFISAFLIGCTASQDEIHQQKFWETEAKRVLLVGMSKSQILEWAKENELLVARGEGMTLLAKRVKTKWPHFPCADSSTAISLKFDDESRLISYHISRVATCL